jgi:cell wall-associated NlpC family hydrolase
MQAEQGMLINLLDEAQPGDLAFFDNAEGKITHVGILLTKNKIIHASGRVRMDMIDHHGIYNEAIRKYTHHLRLIKRLI